MPAAQAGGGHRAHVWENEARHESRQMAHEARREGQPQASREPKLTAWSPEKASREGFRVHGGRAGVRLAEGRGAPGSNDFESAATAAPHSIRPAQPAVAGGGRRRGRPSAARPGAGKNHPRCHHPR